MKEVEHPKAKVEKDRKAGENKENGRLGGEILEKKKQETPAKYQKGTRSKCERRIIEEGIAM